jgi:hypothetical protein
MASTSEARLMRTRANQVDPGRGCVESQSVIHFHGTLLTLCDNRLLPRYCFRLTLISMMFTLCNVSNSTLLLSAPLTERGSPQC